VLDPFVRPDFGPESAFDTQHGALLAHYLKTKAEVDASIRCFAQTLEWPQMSEVEKFFLAPRLDFAWEVSSLLNTFHEHQQVIMFPPPAVVKTPEVIEWLLIDIWPYGCGHFFQKHRWLEDQAPKYRRAASFTQSTCVA
jgi:hypothetical protein